MPTALNSMWPSRVSKICCALKPTTNISFTSFSFYVFNQSFVNSNWYHCLPSCRLKQLPLLFFFLNQIPWGNLHRGSSDSGQKTDLRKEICKELLDMSNSDNYQKIDVLEIQTCFCSLHLLPECWFSYCCGYYICESVSFQGFHISGEWRIEVGKAKITQTFLFLPRFNCSSLRNTFWITVSL